MTLSRATGFGVLPEPCSTCGCPCAYRDEENDLICMHCARVLKSGGATTARAMRNARMRTLMQRSYNPSPQHTHRREVA